MAHPASDTLSFPNRSDSYSILSTDADEYLAVADSLPPAPRILPRLLNLLADPESDINQIVDLITFDPGLTSKLLRACNSAFVGLPEPASDVGEAVHRLGISFVYTMAAAVCGGSAFQTSSQNRLASGLWQHSVTSAFAAEILAADLGMDRGVLFTAALLHDIGKWVLAERWKEAYWELAQACGAHQNLVRKEREIFSLDHAELGGRVLAHWKFPSSIASSVWKHHVPMQGMPFERETACVALAEAMADAVVGQPQRSQCFGATPAQANALQVLHCSPSTLDSYIARTHENFQFVNALCQMGA